MLKFEIVKADELLIYSIYFYYQKLLVNFKNVSERCLTRKFYNFMARCETCKPPVSHLPCPVAVGCHGNHTHKQDDTRPCLLQHSLLTIVSARGVE